ncbi:MAG: FkbM family methyltransferase [Pseudomonadota bacterium]
MIADPNFRFRDLFPDCPIPTIVDVGAGDHPGDVIGMSEMEKLADQGDAMVIGFDGADASIETVRNRANAHRRYVQAFVGDGSERTFYRTNNPLTGSLYKPDRSLVDEFNNLGAIMKVVEEIPVRTVALDDLDEIEDFDGIKLDVQGAELDVLRGAQTKLAGCNIVVTEVEFIPIYEGQALYGDIERFLMEQGFLLHFMPRTAQRMLWPTKPGATKIANLGSQSVWTDVVFTRDFRTFGAISVDKLWKLALIIHDCFRFFDTVSRILFVIDEKTGAKAYPRYVDHLRRNSAAAEPKTEG